MTLTCKTASGSTIFVRTMVLVDENGKTVTESAYMGRTIDVRGIVDYYDGNYQIKVFSASNITVH
jgi:DNA/RNA endonuclease YhcR with UshA esterase domain